MATVLPIAATESAAKPAPSDFSPRALPARSLPVPDTVSAALKPFIAAPYPPGWDVAPQTAAA